MPDVNGMKNRRELVASVRDHESADRRNAMANQRTG